METQAAGPVKMNDATFARFIEKILIGDGCWPWVGAKTKAGYGQMVAGGKKTYAHRLSYQHFNGPIPEKFDIDHLCRTPGCVKPQHLEAVTHRENLRRGASPAWVAHETNTCKRGHSLLDAYKKSKGRDCRTCTRAAQNAKRAASPLAARAAGRKYGAAYRERHRERLREYHRARYAAKKASH